MQCFQAASSTYKLDSGLRRFHLQTQHAIECITSSSAQPWSRNSSHFHVFVTCMNATRASSESRSAEPKNVHKVNLSCYSSMAQDCAFRAGTWLHEPKHKQHAMFFVRRASSHARSNLSDVFVHLHNVIVPNRGLSPRASSRFAKHKTRHTPTPIQP
eukprot:5345926-Amphidinium_carterae.1